MQLPACQLQYRSERRYQMYLSTPGRQLSLHQKLYRLQQPSLPSLLTRHGLRSEPVTYRNRTLLHPRTGSYPMQDPVPSHLQYMVWMVRSYPR